MSSLKFPKDFLWGAATAAHQVEGGTHNQWTIWELENAKDKAKQASTVLRDFKSWDRIKTQVKDPHNYVSGRLANHYDHYQDDFDLLVLMGMNAYRFSVEWSRLEPECGVWDSKAFKHYKQCITELRKRQIEPILTLFHFTLPVWFMEMGGFEKRSNVKYFKRFAKKVIDELGEGVKYVITINEPEVYAVASYLSGDWPPTEKNPYKAWRVIENLILAHKQAAKVIHKRSDSYMVSIAKHSCHIYPGDSSIVSRVSAIVARFIWDDYILRRTCRHSDFLGVNYYQSMRFIGYRISNDSKQVSDLNWTLRPSDIQHVLERLSKKYKLPIIITENGIADSLDQKRKWWLKETLSAMQKAISQGVDLQGYLHWSLIDNFEWAYGRWPRFGLAEVDYDTGKRTLRPSAIWFGKFINKVRNT